MKRLKRATIVLPLLVLLAGAAVPVLVDLDDAGGGSVAEAQARRVAGRTAEEWIALATQAAARDQFDKALKFAKTAEGVESGEQYAAELRAIRKARRRRREISRLKARLTEGPIEDLALDGEGRVLSGHRLTTVLPGESLWSLAREFAAAELAVLPAEVDNRDTYAAWDELTALNGVRELKVGERVALPLTDADAERVPHERLIGEAQAPTAR